MNPDSNISIDGFLDGRVKIAQPKVGYRAGTDPVLLAAACPASCGDLVLDIGCGVGAAALCLAWRVKDVTLIGLEQDQATAQLARDNATRNQINFDVLVGDLFAPPPAFKQIQANHVISNPPYFAKGTVCPPENENKADAWVMAHDTQQWVQFCLMRLRPKGVLTLINRVEQLPAMLGALDGVAGGVQILPISAREGRTARRVIVQAVKGGRAPLSLLAPLYMHSGTAHLRDGDDFSERARQILRDGALLRLRA